MEFVFHHGGSYSVQNSNLVNSAGKEERARPMQTQLHGHMSCCWLCQTQTQSRCYCEWDKVWISCLTNLTAVQANMMREVSEEPLSGLNHLVRYATSLPPAPSSQSRKSQVNMTKENHQTLGKNPHSFTINSDLHFLSPSLSLTSQRNLHCRWQRCAAWLPGHAQRTCGSKQPEQKQKSVVIHVKTHVHYENHAAHSQWIVVLYKQYIHVA